MSFGKAAAAAAIVSALAGAPVGAATFGPAFGLSSGASLSFEIAVPTSTTEDWILTLTLAGDFQNASEFAAVTLDTLDLGTVLNNNPSDDLFSFSGSTTASGSDNYGGGGASNNYNARVTSSVRIAAAEFNAISADGAVVLTIASSGGVNVNPNNTLNFPASYGAPTASNFYAEGSFSAVPLPAGALLLVSAFGVTGFLRRRG